MDRGSNSLEENLLSLRLGCVWIPSTEWAAREITSATDDSKSLLARYGIIPDPYHPNLGTLRNHAFVTVE